MRITTGQPGNAFLSASRRQGAFSSFRFDELSYRAADAAPFDEVGPQDQSLWPVLPGSGDDGAASASGSFPAAGSAAVAAPMVSAMAWSTEW